MKTATLIAQMLVRICGVLLVGLGILFWLGIAVTLIPVHMFLGLVLVISLWTLAFLAARMGAPSSQVITAVVWGLIVPILGVTQSSLLPGSTHWVVQVVHLLVGIGAIGQAEGLAARIKLSLPSSHPVTG